MSAIHIIGEAGTNHNGQAEKALELIDIAADCALDSVKFQIIYPWGLYLPGDYKYGHYDIKEVIRIREEGVMSDEVYEQLHRRAQEREIALTASVFDTRGLDLLCALDPPYIKLASCDLNNTRFIEEVAERGIKMIISTGMSTLADVEKAVAAASRQQMSDIVLLHCVSVYPCELGLTNLRFIESLKKFGYEVGFSDHTGTSTAACMALSLGATWFEKHYTQDKTQKGFDHAYAMEPQEMAAYVKDLREAEKAMTPKADKLSDAELYTRNRARRSLYANKDLHKGHIINNEDILIVRPEGPMDASDHVLLVGSELTRDIGQHQAFTLDHIGSN